MPGGAVARGMDTRVRHFPRLAFGALASKLHVAAAFGKFGHQ